MLGNITTGGTWSSSNTSIAAISSGGIVTAGATTGTTVISYTVTNSCGTVWAIHPITVFWTPECPTAVGGPVASPTNALYVYPDPAREEFTLMLSSVFNEEARVTITNMAGEKVKEITTTTNKETPLRHSLSNGIYFVNATTAHGQWHAKVIVSR
jgi:hypothetical protein